MSAHGPDLSAVIAGTPRELPGKVKMFGLVAIVIGLAGLGVGMATNPDRTLAAFVANFLYFAGISQGAVMFAVALMITQARWARPLKRIAESFVVFLPVMYLLLMVFLLAGGMHIYPWTHEEMPPHKAIYLQPGFFAMRQAVGLGLLTLLSLLFVRASLRPDLGVARAILGDRAPAWWDRLLGDWQGEEAEIAAGLRRQAVLGPILGIAYASLWSMMVIDLSMSLSPHWYANMFPAWYFASCFWSGLVAIAVVGMLARSWLGLEHLLTSKTFHDLGKLTFGFTLFWAYTLFAQYLAIWYGNMNEEIWFILLRTEVEPWAGLAKVVIMTCFLVPFSMLLSRGLKKIPAAYLTVTGVLAVGIWLERFLVVMPSVWTEDTLPLGFPEVGMAIGLLGGMVLAVGKFLSQVPPVALTDPWMAPNPMDVHVHPSDEAHAH